MNTLNHHDFVIRACNLILQNTRLDTRFTVKVEDHWRKFLPEYFEGYPTVSLWTKQEKWQKCKRLMFNVYVSTVDEKGVKNSEQFCREFDIDNQHTLGWRLFLLEQVEQTKAREERIVARIALEETVYPRLKELTNKLFEMRERAANLLPPADNDITFDHYTWETRKQFPWLFNDIRV